MIRIGPGIEIDESELREQFVRSGGPGGQHVNKTSTCCQLRFDVAASENLPEALKRRLARLAGSRMTSEGVLILDASGHRSLKRNRDEARERLIELLQRAARPPKRRRATRPTIGSVRRRLEGKKRRGETKRLRRRPGQGE